MKKNNGDFLEIMTAELERHLTENQGTIIKRRYNVLDREGLDREIDVYCEVEINRKRLKYAIECKDYGSNSPVKMEHIDSFYSKISNHGMKGIFVSTGKFQKNAVEKARKLDIDIYTIADTKFDVIEKVQIHQKRYEIKNIALICEGLEDNFVSQQNKVYVSTEKKERKMSDFLLYTKDRMTELVEKDFHKLFNELFNDEWRIDEKKEYKYCLGFHPGYFVKHVGKFYPIKEAISTLEFWIEIIEVDTTNGKQYQTLNGDLIFAKFFSKKIILNLNRIGYFSFIWVEGEKEPRGQILDEKGEILHTFYDPDKFYKEKIKK